MGLTGKHIADPQEQQHDPVVQFTEIPSRKTNLVRVHQLQGYRRDDWNIHEHEMIRHPHVAGTLQLEVLVELKPEY